MVLTIKINIFWKCKKSAVVSYRLLLQHNFVIWVTRLQDFIKKMLFLHKMMLYKTEYIQNKKHCNVTVQYMFRFAGILSEFTHLFSCTSTHTSTHSICKHLHLFNFFPPYKPIKHSTCTHIMHHCITVS